jgi:hypothetical protein
MFEGSFVDFVSDKYEARIIGKKKNHVLITLPSASHAYIHEFDKFFDVLQDTGNLCNPTQDSHDVARSAMKDMKDRQTKNLLLRFPQGMKLSPTPYSESLTELNCNMIPFETSMDPDQPTLMYGHETFSFIYWKVAIVEAVPRTKYTANGRNITKGEAKLAALIQSMNLG